MTEITDGERVMGRGAKVRLGDGKLYELRFDFEALEIIEEELGTLEKMLAVMKKQGWKSKRVAAIITIMWAALAHNNLTRTEVKKLLVFRDFGAYMDALIVAFNRSMPAPDEEDKRPNAGGSRNGSLGKKSSRSRSSTLAARRRSSGG